MNGAHDMGGVHGFGPVRPEPNEPTFHADWERRAFALTLAMGATGEWNLDASRCARENRPPADYLAKSYYELWTAGLIDLMIARGLLTRDEIAAGRALGPGQRLATIVTAREIGQGLMRGAPTGRPAATPARFNTGDRVRAKNMHPTSHTRLPRYVRGHPGVVERVRGCHVYPDSHATSGDENPQWLYTVRFDARELWGSDADANLTVSVDAFEPYLEPA